jgi:quercetin dioxygenase-like cupin family protein
MRQILLGILCCMLCAPALAAQEAPAYEPATAGTRVLEGGGGFSIRMLVEEANFGGTELEIGEITFPAGGRGGEHRHGSTEIFYILTGELDHIVNGVSHPLTPGMVGIVRVGDSVVHRVTSDEPVKALVIWIPGGEAGRIAPGLRQRPIRP